MKILMTLFLLACLLLCGCALQQKSASVNFVQDQLEVPAKEPIAVPDEVEAPDFEPETPSAPAEQLQVQAEGPAAPVEQPAQSDLYVIKRGDKLTVEGHSLEVYELLNVGTLVTFKIDGNKYVRVSNTKSPEIAEKLEFEIVENNFNKDNTVVMSIKPLSLGKDEYILYKGETATVNVTKLTLDGVKKEKEGEFAWAYFSVPSVSSKQFSVREGGSTIAGNLEVTLERAFHKYREYAVLKIVEY